MCVAVWIVLATTSLDNREVLVARDLALAPLEDGRGKNVQLVEIWNRASCLRWPGRAAAAYPTTSK